MAGSEPWWPPRPTPPPGAANVVVVLADDLGFADLSCYGSEISTPHLDRLAGEGLRYTNFHVAPMCSPTRAALLTGCNPHAAGIGFVAHADPGFPGYAMELADDVATAAEIFRDAGYATLMAGKWHLCKDADLHDAGSKASWPLQRGFDRFYGILDGFTNLHQPHRLYQDNHVVEVDDYPADYYFTDDLTQRAVSMVRSVKASDPQTPFFLYLAHAAVHAPLQARADDIARHRGAYDMGWDALRAARHARQLEMGLIPHGTRLPPRNTEPGAEAPPWDDLPPEHQRLFARYMEVYAAMVQTIDDSVGRLRSALEALGQWDDTIVLFTSDNGASKEGEVDGTSAYFRTLLGQAIGTGPDIGADLARFDEIGSAATLAHYPQGWAMASNTPFRLYKTFTFAGGHSVPMILTLPSRLEEATGGAMAGGIRRQFTHVTDVLPTLLALTGVTAGTHRAGVPVQTMAGTSFAPTIADPESPSAHGDQHDELAGHRGFRRDRWEIVTLHQGMTPFGDHEWHLYDLDADPTEMDDLAAEHPEKVAELSAAWQAAAEANQVYPLDEGAQVKFVQRPAREDVLELPVRIVAGTPTLERYRCLKLVFGRSFTLGVETAVAPGDEGVLVAHGDQGGGYVLYVEGGRLRFAYNAYGVMHEIDGGPLPPGRPTIEVGFTAPGGFVWHVEVRVDGVLVGARRDLRMLLAMAPFEGIDVGIDRRSPVSWPLYEAHGPFPWTGVLDAVTVTPGEPAPDAPSRVLDLLLDLGRAYE